MDNITCFDYEDCHYQIAPCNVTHNDYRYNDASAVWVLIASIIVFFMKAGFLLIELSFATGVKEKRHVVIVKHLDVFASAFGFFLFGFDFISRYSSPKDVPYTFFKVSDPVLWFFKFTFASNAATIIGGCLVTNTYKLRLLAGFISAFVISGVIHPVIARIIWTDLNPSLSPYRCHETYPDNLDCDMLQNSHFSHRMYILDFAGGGAVHLLGGVAGLVLCLFAKLQNFLESRKRKYCDQAVHREEPEKSEKKNFWYWMYPIKVEETTNEAALGVLIIWFCLFAFNCGSTESIQSQPYKPIPFHDIPAIIAVNMTLAAASGGIVAVTIASWAQMHTRSESVNANEIANGVLSALVAITSGCPFVDFWAACIIGAIAVIVYHVACWLEYKFKIEDTARVVPVHGACGLWSMLAVGLLVVGRDAECNLHATFEGLCYCTIRLPHLSYGERLASQIIGAVIMIGVTAVISVIMYGLLFVIPIRSHLTSDGKFAPYYNAFVKKLFQLVCKQEDITFEGNLLFTGPGEIPVANQSMLEEIDTLILPKTTSTQSLLPQLPQHRYGSLNSEETLGSKGGAPDTISVPVNTVWSRSNEIPLSSGARQRSSKSSSTSAIYLSLNEEDEAV